MTETNYRAATPCDAEGNFLEDDDPPPPRNEPLSNDWFPYSCRADFELTDFLYREEQMSAGNITKLLGIMKAYQLIQKAEHAKSDGRPESDAKELDDDSDRFMTNTLLNGDAQKLYNTIDATKVGDVPWKSFSNFYTDENGKRASDENAESWKRKEYDVWYREPLELIRSLVDNPALEGEFDYVPFREYQPKEDSDDINDKERVFRNYMSGNFAWEQAVSHDSWIIRSSEEVY